MSGGRGLYTPLTQAEQQIRRLELLADPRYLLARSVFKAALAAGRSSDQAEAEARLALRQAEHGAEQGELLPVSDPILANADTAVDA